MKNRLPHFLPLLFCLLAGGSAQGQSSPNCATATDDNFLTGEVFFNYGAATNAFNTTQRTTFSIGQPVINGHFGQDFNGVFGFWARLLLPPAAPVVLASEGDLEDRVQIDWNPDPLSPSASGGYKIYRNGSLLASVDGETYSFLDFNVIAGKFYTYEVSGINTFGEGTRGSALGFLNPNGVVTGQVKSFSSNPVPGAIVTLSPTLGTAISFDGTDDMAFAEYNAAYPRNEFTISAWVKIGDGNDGAAIFDLGSTIGKNWWLHTLPAADGKGIRFGVGEGAPTELDFVFPAATASDWHNVAATYNGSILLLYVDGELVSTAPSGIESDSIPLYFGTSSPSGVGGFFTGKLDEVRIFNRQLSQTELQMFQNRTVASNMDRLVDNWKFDEGVGSKSFDQAATKQKVYLCGASWTTDKPSVVNAGVTDETGFYEIAGVNYGAGQTFTAVASKSFYFNQSLEFNAANQDYAQLTQFDLADSTTIEITVKNFDFLATQALLSKQDGAISLFDLGIDAGEVYLIMGKTAGMSEYHSFGQIGMGFHRLTIVFRRIGLNSAEVTFYKNGTLVSTETYTNVAASFSSATPWLLGGWHNDAGTGVCCYNFTGLELAFVQPERARQKHEQRARQLAKS